MTTTPSTEVATRTPAQELVQQVRGQQFTEQVSIALPEGMKPDRFVRVMATALLDNPDLAQADHNSIFQAGLKAAADGLLPDGREAAFVIYNTKVKTTDGDVWVKKAQYIPMVGGFRKIAADHGWSLRSSVVYANDEFDYTLGLDPNLLHNPVRPGMERGAPIAAYAIAVHKDGRREFEVLTAAEIEKVRQTSRAKDRGPWVEWPDRMWEKTAARRLFQKLPLDEKDKERVARVLEATAVEPVEAQRLLYGSARPSEPTNESAPSPVSPTQSAPETGGKPATAEESVHRSETPSAAAAPANDFDGDEPTESQFEPPAGVREQTEAAPSQADLAAQGAGETKFTSGRYSGKSIREVLEEHGQKGRSYLSWAAANWKTQPMKNALRTYLETAASELLA